MRTYRVGMLSCRHWELFLWEIQATFPQERPAATANGLDAESTTQRLKRRVEKIAARAGLSGDFAGIVHCTLAVPSLGNKEVAWPNS